MPHQVQRVSRCGWVRVGVTAGRVHSSLTDCRDGRSRGRAAHRGRAGGDLRLHRSKALVHGHEAAPPHHARLSASRSLGRMAGRAAPLQHTGRLGNGGLVVPAQKACDTCRRRAAPAAHTEVRQRLQLKRPGLAVTHQAIARARRWWAISYVRFGAVRLWRGWLLRLGASRLPHPQLECPEVG